MLELWDGGRGLVVLAVICLLGLLWRQRAARRYRRIARQCENLDTTRDRRLRALRSQFEELSHLRNGIENLPIFLRRALGNDRVRGLTLRRWDAMANAAAFLDLLGGLLLAAVAFTRNQDIRTIVFYGASGVVLGAVGVLTGILTDNAGREEQALICLQDAFENQILPALNAETRDREEWSGRERSRTREAEAPPVYTLKPEEEAVVEEIFQEYFS
ncbi:MAG: hypothetical protein LUF34_10935 [Lachnospiraceae bacterium]|nr:hypothetical protein [Lachnospiraceae bacterium]